MCLTSVGQINMKCNCSAGKKTQTNIPFFFFSCLLLRFVLKGFTPEGRDLSDKETKALLAAGDKDGDGKIGADGM